MKPTVNIAGRSIGKGHPCYLIAEIGINHNGDVENVFKLIDAAVDANFDAVKFQKRTPRVCVPRDQWDVERDTPWGVMKYIDYREKTELGVDEFNAIDSYAREKGITWFASCWDEPSVDFMEEFDIPCHKIASALITKDELLKKIAATARPVLMSTGMSTMQQIRHAVEILDSDNFMLAHCTSSYPASYDELNLHMIQTLAEEFDCPVGYSGHEVGLSTTVASVALGAAFVERHITLNRAMWGSDQAASVEPQGMTRLARDIRLIESALGDGVKKVYDSELPMLAKLRGN
ncbi:MAG: N-acetylneuraminate synthase family protein [Chloroflexi bacterium]|nr:N-acetylneuraminate synthase family protein [Chloroflexota bacterium]